MLKNILVAIDGSSHAQVAAETGISLAKRLGARLDALHVIDLWLLRGSFLHDVNGMLGIEPQLHMAETVETFLETRAASVIEGYQLTCKRMGFKGHGHSVTGLVSEEISTAAAQHDLLVLGARGVSIDGGQGIAGRHLPSQLLSEVTVPMLITNRDSETIGHSVVAFDGSAGSFRALAIGAELAYQADIPLNVMWVDSGGLEYEGKDALDLARRYLEPYELEAKLHSREGVPRKEIPQWMEEIGANLLITGSHGPSRLREFLLGHLPGQLLEQGLSSHLLVCP